MRNLENTTGTDHSAELIKVLQLEVEAYKVCRTMMLQSLEMAEKRIRELQEENKALARGLQDPGDYPDMEELTREDIEYLAFDADIPKDIADAAMKLLTSREW